MQIYNTSYMSTYFALQIRFPYYNLSHILLQFMSNVVLSTPVEFIAKVLHVGQKARETKGKSKYFKPRVVL